MAKNPIFPLYYNDIDRTCRTWTDEEYGCYVRLLVEQWDKGGIPTDPERRNRLATSAAKHWALIGPKFEQSGDVLKNPRLEEIREEKKKHKEKQRDTALKRYQKTYQKSTKQSTKNLPLEGEGEREDEDELKKNKGVPAETLRDAMHLDWEMWGTLIVDDGDHHWEQMKGRRVTREEMNEFLSVAIRNDWQMDSAHKFRVALRGFDGKTGKQKTGTKLVDLKNL